MARNEKITLITKIGNSWAATRVVNDGLSWSVDRCSETEAVGGSVPAEITAAAKEASSDGVIVLDLGQSLLVKELSVPVVSSEQQDEAIRHEVEAALPFSIERARWDVLKLDEDTIEQRYMLLAAREDDVDASILEIVEMSQSAASRLEAFPAAFGNLVGNGSKSGEALVSLYLSAEGSFMLFTGCEVPAVRSLNVRTSTVDSAAASKLQAEVMRGMAAFRRQESDWNPRRLHLYGPHAKSFSTHLTLPGEWEQTVVSADQVREESSIEGLEPVPDGHLAAVVGIAEALGGIGVGDLSCSLRTSAERAAVSNRVSTTGWWAAALFILLAGLAWVLPPWIALKGIDSALINVSAEAAPLKQNAAALGDFNVAIGSQLERLDALADLIDSRSVWNNTLVDLQSRLMAVENVWFDGLDFRIVEGAEGIEGEAEEGSLLREMVLKGRLLDPEHPLERVSPEMQARVNDLIDRLEASRYISAVTEKRFEPLDGGLLQFTLILEMSGDWSL